VNRDLLNVLTDKCQTIKNLLNDRLKCVRIFEELGKSEKVDLNKKIEEIISLMEKISFYVLFGNNCVFISRF